MQELQLYLTGQFYQDREEMEKASLLINDVKATLLRTFNPKFGWPYMVTRGGPDPVTKLSHSTTAMVTLSLMKLQAPKRAAARINPHPLAPMKRAQADQLGKVVDDARCLLVNDICAGEEPGTKSQTFGDNDPTTLSFITELLSGVAPDPADEKIRAFVTSRVEVLCKVTDFQDPTKLWNPSDPGHRPIGHALIALRVMRALHHLKLTPRPAVDHYRRFFESTLHEQLSFSLIPDSRFDPGELTFCLEGLLLAQPEAVDKSIFQRTLDVLAHSQKENAFWRPNKPILATAQGLSLFPVSVEIANSLSRSCLLYDGDELFETFSSTSVELFRRYWRWLCARTIRFHTQGSDYIGWNSEHVNEATSIHVWETSQVLEFLFAYYRLLRNHIARRTLVLSRFNVKPANFPKDLPTWAAIRDEYEPVNSLGPTYAVYERIGTDFVNGWRDNIPTNYSMLLYGPPGTGKTTVAENIARVLRTRIVNISVSDFLGGGSAEIEARAKAIFDVLNSQHSCVVLLDEIDQLILDRDSSRYSRQQDIFQFMTPGMLTKLNDLRAAERVLLIIATNYGNRIDSAIKRPGRIDQQYLVLPPDSNARRAILNRILSRAALPVDCEINPAKIDEGGWRKLVSSSLFLGFKEIEAAVLRVLQLQQLTPQQLLTSLDTFPRTTSLTVYEPRLRAANSDSDSFERPPEEEFICLLAMKLGNEDNEVEPELDGVLRQASQWFAKGHLDQIGPNLHKCAPSLDPTSLTGVQSLLESYYAP